MIFLIFKNCGAQIKLKKKETRIVLGNLPIYMSNNLNLFLSASYTPVAIIIPYPTYITTIIKARFSIKTGSGYI